MYKVFVNDCPIILTENKNISTNLPKVDFEKKLILAIVKKMLAGKAQGICFLCDDLKSGFKKFKTQFKIEKAAGGKVYNEKNEVLFIYRFDKWDLPKGKLEKGEQIENCALREVEEECGINGLQIVESLGITYHIFERKNKIILKITHWFLMKTNFSGELIPQTEEGISVAVFKNEDEKKEALQNTYENIRLLF